MELDKVKECYSVKCKECKDTTFQLTDEQSCMQHFYEVHHIRCRSCKDSFTNREKMRQHFDEKHKDYTTCECGSVFKSASAFAMHIEATKKRCSVPQKDIVEVLTKHFENAGGVQTEDVFSPIGCFDFANVEHRVDDFARGYRKLTAGYRHGVRSFHHDNLMLMREGDLKSSTVIQWKCRSCLVTFDLLSTLMQHVEHKLKERMIYEADGPEKFYQLREALWSAPLEDRDGANHHG